MLVKIEVLLREYDIVLLNLLVADECHSALAFRPRSYLALRHKGYLPTHNLVALLDTLLWC